MKKSVLMISFILFGIFLVSMFGVVSAQELWRETDFTSTGWSCIQGNKAGVCAYGSYLDVAPENGGVQTVQNYIPDISGYKNIILSVDIKYVGGGWDSTGDYIVISVWDGSNWRNVKTTPTGDGINYQDDGLWHTYTSVISDVYISSDFRIKIIQYTEEESKEDAWYDNIVLTGDRICVETNGGVETCDGIDNNCDGQIDEGVCVCGNGLIENKTGYLEECDDGNNENNDLCLANCLNARVGDGWIQEGVEECDDSNIDNGDGCDDNGIVEDGWGCVGEPSTCTENECFPIGLYYECNEEGFRTGSECVLDESTNATILTETGDDEDCYDQGLFCAIGGCYGENEIPPKDCGDYSNQEDCDSAPQSVCDASVNDYIFAVEIEYTPSGQVLEDGFCETNWPIKVNFTYNNNGNAYGECSSYATDCSCEWLGDAEGEGCGVSFTKETRCGNLTFIDDCTFTTITENNCDTTGFITYTRKSQNQNCEDYIKTYKCVETAKLPFFGTMGIVIALIIIGVVYYIHSRKPVIKNKGPKKSRKSKKK